MPIVFFILHSGYYKEYCHREGLVYRQDRTQHYGFYGNRESLAELNKYENDLFKKKLDELTEKEYNIYDISAYAANMLYSLNKKYYEAYTEYRVLQILSG